jgi:hypothetical protein
MYSFRSLIRHYLPKTVIEQLNDKIRMFSTWSILLIVLLSCNQTAIFASTKHNQDSFTLKISADYSVKISPQTQQAYKTRSKNRHNTHYKARYEIRLFNHHTNEQHSTFIRPIFGKITEILLNYNIITVFMEGTNQQKHYVALDHYQMAHTKLINKPHYANNDDNMPNVYLKHLHTLPSLAHADVLSAMHVIYNTQQFPKDLPQTSGFAELPSR